MGTLVEDATIYLEIDGLAEDENGNSAPAGVSFSIGHLKNPVKYCDFVRNVNIDALIKAAGLDSIVSVSDVKIISPSYYFSQYGDEEVVKEDDDSDERDDAEIFLSSVNPNFDPAWDEI